MLSSTIELIGNTTLNIALFAYLSHYFPQLWHNKQVRNLREMSLLFHGLLLAAYWMDLLYAFGVGMPWQYCMVSLVGLSCLLYQHYQLERMRNSGFSISLLIIAFVSVVSIFFLALPRSVYLILEYFSQIAGIACLLPQLIRNAYLASARSLNIIYLILNVFIAICDTISSWCLSWPLPNRMGASIHLILGLILLGQWFYLHQRQRNYAASEPKYDKVINFSKKKHIFLE